jgi:hypothetical protein
MSRSIMSGVIGVAVLLGTCIVGQASFGQAPWNNGFGPRDYGYSGNAYAGSNFGGGAYQGNRYSGNYGPHCGYGSQRYSAGYPTYYSNYSGVGLGGFSTGAYGYSTAPMYNSYRPGISLSIGVVPPTSPYYAPFNSARPPLHHHHHHDQVHAYRSAW